MIAKLLMAAVPFGLVALALAHVADVLVYVEHALRLTVR